MKTYVKRITPEMATKMLEGHDNVRPWQHRLSRLYAQEMKAGRWRMNGEAIKLNGNGKLLDGQHRLQAVVMAEMPVEFLVVEGLESTIVPTIDGGARRTAPQVLRKLGHKNVTALCATLRLVLIHQRRGSIQSRGVEDFLTPTLAIEALADNPLIEEVVAMVGPVGGVCSQATVATCAYIGEVSPNGGQTEFTEAFVKGVSRGANLAEDDPRFVLRRRMESDKASKGKLPTQERNALIVLAWNAWVAERAVKIIKWNSAGPRKSDFPVIEQAPLLEEGERFA